MRSLVAIVVVLLATHVAFADEAVPWAAGVSDADQKRANALFDEGNGLFARQAHTAALEKYQAAIAIWDHPLIRYNMAVTLLRLDRLLEAADAFDSALRFGQAPFTSDIYQQLLDYQRLVRGRIGELEVTCTQAGAEVLLDGKRWFQCPGTQKRRVLVGEHTIVGQHPQLIGHAQTLVVIGDEVAHANVSLVSLDAAMTTSYRFQRWIPWTVFGGGVLIGLAGAFFEANAASELSNFDKQVSSQCQTTGCDFATDLNLKSQYDHAKRLDKIGNVVLWTGLGVTVTGIVLVVINRPQHHLPKLDVAPSPTGVSASAEWRF